MNDWCSRDSRPRRREKAGFTASDKHRAGSSTWVNRLKRNPGIGKDGGK